MPDVQPTNNPVPSDNPADARDNFKRIDEVVNSTENLTSPTRTGVQLVTLHRYNELVQPNIDGARESAAEAAASASASAASASAAEAAVSGLDYQGLWPDSGGSANKGDTYQTQVSGTPTGQYFTALQNTTVAPASDDINWRGVISVSGLSQYAELSFDTFSDLDGLKVGDIVTWKGFYSINDGGSATVVIEGSAPSDLPHKDIGEGLYAVYLDNTVKLKQYGITPNDEVNIQRNTTLAAEFWSDYGYLVDNFAPERGRDTYYFTDLDLKLDKSGTSINNFNMACIADTITTPVIDFDTPDSTISFTRIVNMTIAQSSSVANFNSGIYSNDRDFWSTDITVAGGSRKSAPRTTIQEVRFRGFKCPLRAAMWNSKIDKVNFDNCLISGCIVGTSINFTECYTVNSRYSFAIGCDYNPDSDTIIQTAEGLAYSHFDTFLNDQIQESVLITGRVQGCTITAFGVEEMATSSPAYSKGIIKIAPEIDGPSNININGGAFVQALTSQCLIDSTLNTASGSRTTIGLEGVAFREVDRLFVNDESGNVSPILNNNDDFNSIRGSNQYGSQHVNVDSRVPLVPPTTRNKFEVQFNAASQEATVDEYQLNTALRPGNRVRIPVGASVGSGQGFFLSAKFDVFPMYSSPQGANANRFAYGEVNAHLYRFSNTGNADLVSSYSPIISSGLTDRVSVTFGFYPSTQELYVDIQINSDDPSQTSMLIGSVRAGSNFINVRKIAVL